MIHYEVIQGGVQEMKEYHKINTIFKRDMEHGGKHIIEGAYSMPEFEYLANNEWMFTEKVDGCLHYGNNVYTDAGRLPIGRIVEKSLGVQVASYNSVSGVVEYKPIVHFHKEPRVRPFHALTCRSRGRGNRPKTIVCTDNHKFYVDGEWLRADLIGDGMMVSHYENKLTIEQQQVLLGGLLGDSSIYRPSATTRGVSFVHCEEHADYLHYKRRLLSGICGNITHYDNDGYSDESRVVRMNSRVTKPVSSLVMQLCENGGRKTVTHEWCDLILPLGLAIWYMDDGSCHFSSKQRPRARFATNAFSENEVDILKAMLRNKFHIDCESFDYKGQTIVLSADGTERLFCVVAPYISNCMKYKIAKRYADSVAAVPEMPEVVSGIVDTEVIRSSKQLPKRAESQQSFQYDLTVGDNSNYFCNGILVHNTNIRVMWKHGQVEFGGKSDNASIPATLISRLRERFPHQDAFASAFQDCTDGVCLYGEGYGAKIQKGGGNYRPDQDFVLFDVKVGDWWLKRQDVIDVAGKMGLDVVPVIGYGTLHDCVAMVRHGLQSVWGPFEAEGIVARPAVELTTRSGARIITKIKSRDFRKE